jgi:uroporphyrinogen decarboxylase
MNSRERALAAINLKEPDQVPIDLGSTIVTSITRKAYTALRTYLNMPPDPAPNISHRQMDTVYPMEDLLRCYGVDFRPVCMKGPWYFKTHEIPEEDAFYDEYNMKWRKASYYYDVIERPLAKAETVADVEKATWPNPYDPGRIVGIREEAQALYNQGVYLIVADIMCLGPFEGACFLRGYENFLTDLYLNPSLAEAILDKVLELDIQLWDVFLQQVGDLVDVVAQGDDIGMQQSMYISPKLYCRMIKPRHQKLYDFIHSKTKAKVFMHSCGSVYDAIPDLIEVGVQILNPIQRSAAKMDIAKLKQEFGKDLCFWGGGIDVQQVLPYASLNEIEREVKYAMDTLGPGGGFVFVPSHNIQADVTPDRIHAVYEAALKYR